MNEIAGALAILTLLSSPGLAYSFRPIPLPELVCNADAIVRGKLSGTQAHFLSITYERERPPIKIIFDRAELNGGKILKTHRKLDPRPLSVIFVSPDQPEKAFPKWAERYFEGDEGIWFLYRDGFGPAYYRVVKRIRANQEGAILDMIANTKCEEQRR